MQSNDREAKRLFKGALDSAETFPTNLIDSDSYEYTLEKYVTTLDDAVEDGLFCEDPEDVEVDVHELWDRESKFKPFCVRNIHETQECLAAGFNSGALDPRCRFIFLHAPDSQSPLNISREVLSYALTYLQAMPVFLDFIFPFGDQDFPKDLQFTGFRYENQLNEADRGLQIRDFGRSGRRIQMCYNLKSPEVSTSPKWSIRQTAVYHSFDIETGRSAWVLVKGNDLMKDRIIRQTEISRRSASGAYSSAGDSFSASFEPHLIVCDWAGDWRWYIKSLEDDVQALSRRINWVSLPTLPGSADGPAEDLNNHPKIKPLRRQFTSRLVDSAPVQGIKRAMSSKARSNSNPLTNTKKQTQGEPKPEITFHILQQLHFEEEKANEALLILKANIRVLEMLRQYYSSTYTSKDFHHPVRLECDAAMARFENRIHKIIDDLQIQKSRLEGVTRLISDRKTQLYSMLQYLNTHASTYLAHRTQELTVEMNHIAKKTEESTISMKAITVVTLLFLPGTFISTLMSTDIIKFIRSESGAFQKSYSSAALNLYLEISIPLTVFTVLFWIIMYQYTKRREKFELKILMFKHKMGLGTDENV